MFKFALCSIYENSILWIISVTDDNKQSLSLKLSSKLKPWISQERKELQGQQNFDQTLS